MTVLNIPLQFHFLYNGKWSSKVDATLIDTTVTYKADLEWKGSNIPCFFLMAAAREIHNMCGSVFNVPELTTRVRLFMMRCDTFKEVIDAKGTYWDRSDHFVHAADSVWKKIIEVRVRVSTLLYLILCCGGFHISLTYTFWWYHVENPICGGLTTTTMSRSIIAFDPCLVTSLRPCPRSRSYCYPRQARTQCIRRRTRTTWTSTKMRTKTTLPLLYLPPQCAASYSTRANFPTHVVLDHGMT